MPRKKYSAPNIPEEMKKYHQEQIDAHPEWGYSSFAEYIRDAMRFRMENLLKVHKKEKKELEVK